MIDLLQFDPETMSLSLEDLAAGRYQTLESFLEDLLSSDHATLPRPALRPFRPAVEQLAGRHAL